ncbi:hypothetical protein, partial [Bacillus cereus]
MGHSHPTNVLQYYDKLTLLFRYIDVQILGINDFHGQLDTVKKINNKEAGGADYLATYLKERK